MYPGWSQRISAFLIASPATRNTSRRERYSGCLHGLAEPNFTRTASHAVSSRLFGQHGLVPLCNPYAQLRHPPRASIEKLVHSNFYVIESILLHIQKLVCSAPSHRYTDGSYSSVGDCKASPKYRNTTARIQFSNNSPMHEIIPPLSAHNIHRQRSLTRPRKYFTYIVHSQPRKPLACCSCA